MTDESQVVAKLVSVNVGLPREITWQGQTVFTGIWKEPVEGPRTVRRLNVDGDGQGDLQGHGGEHRAVYVYQLDSYRYWQDQMQPRRLHVRPVRRELHGRGARRRRGLHRRPLSHRLGAVRGHPAAGHLLPGRDPDGRAAHGRAPRRPRPTGLLPPRARRGRRAGGRRRHEDRDRARGDDGRRLNALLYLAGRHDVEQLRRALRIPALSPGWQASLQALLDEAARGFAGRRERRADGAGSAAGVARLSHAAGRGQAIGDQRRRVPGARVRRRSALARRATRAVHHAQAQARATGSSPLVRSYSLSGSPGDAGYRIGVKVEPHGAAGQYIRPTSASATRWRSARHADRSSSTTASGRSCSSARASA